MMGSAKNADLDHVRAIAKANFATSWQEFDNMTVIAVYDKDPFRNHPDREGPELSAALAEHYDYHEFFRNYWTSIPLDTIADAFSDLATAYLHIFCDPRLFHPNRTVAKSMFLWPWQRCLITTDAHEVNYQAIPTTSLVLDLRNSTTAMNLLDTEERYAEFIDEIADKARGVIVKQGGFFDKETGDGIVAHFCNLLPADASKREASSVSRAFEAAQEAGHELMNSPTVSGIFPTRDRGPGSEHRCRLWRGGLDGCRSTNTRDWLKRGYCRAAVQHRGRFSGSNVKSRVP